MDDPEPGWASNLGERVGDGAAAAAAAMRPEALPPSEGPQPEAEPWRAEELAIRRELLARLQGDGWSAAQLAALPSADMLRFVRGYHDKAERLEFTHAEYSAMVAWRREIRADALLAAPPPEIAQRHGEWRRQWHMDIFGEDSSGHPIMAHRMGQVDPAALISAFSFDLVKRQYVRDIDFLGRRKRELSATRGSAVYKHVIVLDMDGFGWGHFGAEFREALGLIQKMYPEVMHRTFVINTPMMFRAIW